MAHKPIGLYVPTNVCPASVVMFVLTINLFDPDARVAKESFSYLEPPDPEAVADWGI